MSRRNRHFNPAGLGCQVVLDARFITGLSSGAAVSSWTGRPGTSVNASQATALNQPTFQPTGIGGQAAVRFDGSNDIMTLNATTLFQNVASGNTWIVVRDDNRAAGDASHTPLHFATGISATAARATLFTRLSSSSVFVTGGRRLDADTFSSGGTIASTANATILGGAWNWSSGTHAVRVNGVQGTNGSFSSGSGNTTNSASLAVIIGGTDAATSRMQGDIAAAIAVTPSVSTPNCKRIEHHLAFSFGVACA